MSFQLNSVRDSISKWISGKPQKTPLSSPGKNPKTNTTVAASDSRVKGTRPLASHSCGNSKNPLNAVRTHKSALLQPVNQPSKSNIAISKQSANLNGGQGVISHDSAAPPRQTSRAETPTVGSDALHERYDQREGSVIPPLRMACAQPSSITLAISNQSANPNGDQGAVSHYSAAPPRQNSRAGTPTLGSDALHEQHDQHEGSLVCPKE